MKAFVTHDENGTVHSIAIVREAGAGKLAPAMEPRMASVDLPIETTRQAGRDLYDEIRRVMETHKVTGGKLVKR